MHIRNVTQLLEISYVVKNEWHLPVHRHTHYELLYILRGRGSHFINDYTEANSLSEDTRIPKLTNT
jgi:hypothetical protein